MRKVRKGWKKVKGTGNERDGGQAEEDMKKEINVMENAPKEQ